MHSDTSMAWDVKTDYAVQPIRPIRIGDVTPWRGSIENRIYSVLHMGQGGMTVNIIVRRPCSQRHPIVSDERNLMSQSIE